MPKVTIVAFGMLKHSSYWCFRATLATLSCYVKFGTVDAIQITDHGQRSVCLCSCGQVTVLVCEALQSLHIRLSVSLFLLSAFYGLLWQVCAAFCWSVQQFIVSSRRGF